MTKKYDPIVLKNAYEGDEKAIEKILKTFKGYVIIWNKMFNGDEDSYQVGEIAIIEAIRSFDYKSKHNFSTYVYKKIKYAILNYLKKERKNIGLVYDENLEEIEDIKKDNMNIEGELLDKLIVTLDESEKEVIESLITGKKLVDIAVEKNTTLRIVEVIYENAVDKMKKNILEIR